MRDNREPKLLCALLLAGVAQLAWTGAAGSEIDASDVQSVRLVDGPSPHQGRMEFQVGGAWHSYCQYNSSASLNAAANVTCRQLGFQAGLADSGPAGYVVNHTLQPYLSGSLECFGDEVTLAGCNMSISGPPGACDTPTTGGGSGKQGFHPPLLWAICEGYAMPTDGSVVRLADGPNDAEGRLEVQLQPGGEWHEVVPFGYECADRWQVARVACRQLGKSGGSVHEFFSTEGVPSPSLAPISVCCSGNETSLAQCMLVMLTVEEQNALAGVLRPLVIACSGAQSISVVRLSGGLSPNEGLLEVLGPDGQWLHVGNGDHATAHVACRQLGLGGGAVRRSPSSFRLVDPPSINSTFDVFQCSGDEAGLAECGFTFSSGVATELAIFGVACTGSRTIEDLRLASDSTPAGSPVLEGRLEAKVNGTWGLVCDATPEKTTIAAICHQLRFSGGAKTPNGTMYVKGGSMPPLLSYISCPEEEPMASLEACDLSGVSSEQYGYFSPGVPGEWQGSPEYGPAECALGIKCEPVPA